MSFRARLARRVAGRRQRRSNVPDAVRRNLRKDVLFVSGPGGDARRYRCEHRREELELAGATADVAYWDGLPIEAVASHYECIVLYRVSWDSGVEALFSAAAGRCALVSDFDDLVFDSGVKEMIRGRDALSERERRDFDDALHRMQRTLRAADAAVLSTDPLATAAGRYQSSVQVAYNSLSMEMVEAARDASTRRAGRTTVVIAYLSGTRTHDYDFREAAGAVLWALERFPKVRLTIVGYLDLDERFAAFEDRVFRVEYQPWQRLPRILADVDVNLAPLESGNSFVDGKSCLKYLEAGVMSVPTIASPRPDFRRVITDAVNGFLADSPDEWRSALNTLVTSADARRSVGHAARTDVLERHTTAARSAEVRALFSSLTAT